MENIALGNLVEYQRNGRSHPGQREHLPDKDILDAKESLIETSVEDPLVWKGNKSFNEYGDPA